MRTTRPVRSGDEILNDYGELPRSELLRRYGYVTDNYAQYDTVEISEGLVVDIGKQRIGISDEDVELRVMIISRSIVLS